MLAAMLATGCGSEPSNYDLSEECPGWRGVYDDVGIVIAKCAHACPRPPSGQETCFYEPDQECTVVEVDGLRGCCIPGPDFVDPQAPDDHFVVSFVTCL